MFKLNVEKLYQEYNIDNWYGLFPDEQQYVLFEPHLIYATHKMDDVYYAFANARSYLSDYECDNYGQLISVNDDLHLKYIRSKLLQSSLAFYNYAIDLTWQVAWFYVGDNSYLFMEKPELYDTFAKKCTKEALFNKLSMYRKEHIRIHINDFFNLELTTSIRNVYNYVKHRGTLYTRGLGEQYSNFMLFFQDSDGEEYIPKMITREVFDLNEWHSKLIDFDKSFYEYFELLISWILPSDFSEVKIGFTEYFNYILERKHFAVNDLERYLERFRNFY